MTRAKAVLRRILAIADRAPVLAQRRCLPGVVDACLSLCRIYSIHMDRKQPSLVLMELEKKAIAAGERAMGAARRFRGIIDEGLLARTKENEEEATELAIKGAIAMSICSTMLSKLDASVSLLEGARGLVKDLSCENSAQWLFTVLDEEGKVLGKQGKWAQAIERCYDKQLDLASGELDDDHVADAQYNMALACYHLKDYGLARSTVLTCIDTCKLRCSDQTKQSRAEQLLQRIFEACERNDELDTLDDKIAAVQGDPGALLDYRFQKCRLLMRTESYREAFEASQGLPSQLDRGSFPTTIRRRVFRLVSEAARGCSAWSDVMFYTRKWLELINNQEEAQDERITALSLLVEAHVASKTIDASVLCNAQQALQGAQPGSSQAHFLLSHLSAINEALGHPAEASRYRQECLDLAAALQLQSEVQGDAIQFDAIEETSYFADRKVSRTTRSLMGGDFQMKTKAANKTGIIAKRRVRAPTTTTTEAPRANVKKKVKNKKIADEEIASSSDLGDFIASLSESDDEEEKENLAKKPRKTKNHSKQSMVLLSSDPVEDERLEEQFSQLSTNFNEFAEEMNDCGPPQYSDHANDWTRPNQALQPYRQLALRVRVHVGERVLAIPCLEDDIAERKKVSWLIQEASRRYAELDAKEPIITGLSIGIGATEAWLSPNDPVSLVLTDGQVVVAHIDGWRQRSWLQEYQYQGQRLECPIDQSISEAFSHLSSDAVSIDLSMLTVESSAVPALTATLKAKGSAENPLNLNISGTIGIGPAILFGIPLKCLDLSFVVLDETAANDLVSLIEANWSTLEELNLAFVQFSNHASISAVLSAVGHIDAILAKLELSGMDLTRCAGLRSLRYLPKLHSLYLDGSLVDDEAVNQFSALLQTSSTLSEVSMKIFNAEQARALNTALPQAHSLKTLDLLDTSQELRCQVSFTR